MKGRKKVLLVEPEFPIPPKSRNHKNFLPIGLLKIASYLRTNGHEVQLVRGKTKLEDLNFAPDEVWVTSLFTYWSKYVRESTQYYGHIFPNAKLIVGGIYASLMPKYCKEFTGCDEVHVGIYEAAESHLPAYDLVNDNKSNSLDYQIIHASRGCTRHCEFCGTWRIESNFKGDLSTYSKVEGLDFLAKWSVIDEIKEYPDQNRIVFYDNNLLINPYIESILCEIIEYRNKLVKDNKINKNKKSTLICESQSGFDGRVLADNPSLAILLKRAGFRDVRIAWDHSYEDYPGIKKQLDILNQAGFHYRDIYVFMVYNWKYPFEVMEKKRLACWDWKVQIADCRFRPLDALDDNYNPKMKNQSTRDYYIHPAWTDNEVKQFRRNVREQNICVRQRLAFYSNDFEHKRFSRNTMKRVKELQNTDDKTRYLETIKADYWFPSIIRYP